MQYYPACKEGYLKQHVVDCMDTIVFAVFRYLTSAYKLCKQFRPRSGPTEHRPRSGSKPFDTLTVFLKIFLKKLILKSQQTTTKA